MTYSEKLKELRDLSKVRQEEYQLLSDRYKSIIDHGYALSAEQSEERHQKFSEYQEIFANYYDLLAFISKNKIKMTEEIES